MRQKLSNRGDLVCTDHLINLKWQFWCIALPCTNLHTLGLRAEEKHTRCWKSMSWRKRPALCRAGEWVESKISLSQVQRGWGLGPVPALPFPSPENSFLCLEKAPKVNHLCSSSRLNLMGRDSGKSFQVPGYNKTSHINSQTPTWNQSFVQVLSLRRKRWNEFCPQRSQTKPMWKCFDSWDTKPFIFGSFQYLEQYTYNTFPSTWIVPNCWSKLIFHKLLSGEVRR
jgi:hypothetical protein